MSRRNNKTKPKPIDNTKNNIYSGGGDNRRVFKKIGNKGDYAIIKSVSSDITLNKTGSGKSDSPYAYHVGLRENFNNTLSDYKTRGVSLNTKLSEVKANITKQAKAFRNLVSAQNIINFEATFNFKNVKNQPIVPIEVLNNNTSVNCIISKEYKEGTSKETYKYKNNCFYIRFERNEPINQKINYTGVPYVEYSVDNNNLTLDVKKEYIKFKIKEINTSNYITYNALSKHDDTKIKFVIEFGYIEKKESNITSSVSVGGSGGSGY